MTVTQYVGARYVPLFADPIEWSKDTAYEPLTIVIHEGNSYTSRQAVPKGIDIANDEFWALTSNYNAQVESYRKETAKAVEDASNALSLAQTNEQDIATLDSEMAGTADSGLKSLIEEKTETVEEIAIKSKQVSMPLVMPTRNGSIRISTEYYNDEIDNNNIFWPQGLCLDSTGKIFCALIDASKKTNNASIYTRENETSNAFSKLATNEFFHAGSMTTIDSRDKLLIAKGADGVFYECDKSTGNKEKEFDLDVFNSSTLLSFDKKTKKLYASNYGRDLFELSTDGNYTPTKIDTFDNGMLTESIRQNSVLQDLCVNENNIYMLFSSPMMIVKLNMSNEVVASCRICDNDTYAYVGETEGIDVYDGNIYISSYASWTRTSHAMTRIWTIPDSLKTVPTFTWGSATRVQSHVVTCDEQSATNLLLYQTPTGTTDNAFVCINEALEYVSLNPQCSLILINGYHRKEAVYISAPVIELRGKTDKTKDSLGYIETTASQLKLANFNIAPLKKNLEYYVNAKKEYADIGYDSTSMGVYVVQSGAPTSGYVIGTKGRVYTMDSVNNAWPQS